MNWYLYQEVRCPFCKKKYMTKIFENYDTELKVGDIVLKGWKDICPKCQGSVFVVDDQLEGIDLKAYPEEDIFMKLVLR